MKLFPIILALFISVVGIEQNAQADKNVGTKVAQASLTSFDQIDHSAWNTLLKKYVNNAGMVNYAAWNKSSGDVKALNEYLNQLSSGNSKAKSSRGAKLAFWINAYNAVTVRGILDEYPTKSIRKHTAKVFGYNIWEDLFLNVGGKKFNLETMEHKILRKMGDFRIHAGIVCASISCPRLLNEAYTKDKVTQQLEKNLRNFFAQKKNFRYEGGNFKLSSILKWFKEDFGNKDAAVLKTIAPFLPTDEAKAAALAGKGDISYLDYNWNLNKQ